MCFWETNKHKGKQEHDHCWSGTGLESSLSDSALPCQLQVTETETERETETDRDRDRDRHTDRDRHRGFGCIAGCVPSPLCCKPLSILQFTRFDVGMERCNVSSAALREKVPRMESSIWTAFSRVAMRSVQDPVVPQQGHVPGLQQAEGHETGRVHQRVVTDNGLATAGWKSL